MEVVIARFSRRLIDGIVFMYIDILAVTSTKVAPETSSTPAVAFTLFHRESNPLLVNDGMVKIIRSFVESL